MEQRGAPSNTPMHGSYSHRAAIGYFGPAGRGAEKQLQRNAKQAAVVCVGLRGSAVKKLFDI
jgi:hypothetical protein